MTAMRIPPGLSVVFILLLQTATMATSSSSSSILPSKLEAGRFRIDPPPLAHQLASISVFEEVAEEVEEQNRKDMEVIK